MRPVRLVALFIAACAGSGGDPSVRPARVARRPADVTPEATAPVIVDAGSASADAGLTGDEAAPPGQQPVAAGPSTSIGGPNDGRLLGGVPLPARGEGFALNERRLNPDSFYGTTEMIAAITRAAGAVAREMPGSTLIVNDIGFREGGRIPHHASHQAGRDADILFYLQDRRGGPVVSRGIVVEPDGTGVDFKALEDPADDETAKLDVRRTWRFVRALVEDEEALVQRMFVAEHVRVMLLAEAARVRAPRRAIERAGDAMCQPGTPHDDHIHLRLFCSDEDLRAGCLDGHPMYPWRRRALLGVGFTEPLPTVARRRREREEREPSAAPAERPAMHRSVRELLERRKGWSRVPHPGRPWCM